MFVDEACVYKISINGMKEMEKGDEEHSFSLRKSSLISYKGLAPLGFLGNGKYLFEALCHASQLCVCIGIKIKVGAFCRV